MITTTKELLIRLLGRRRLTSFPASKLWQLRAWIGIVDCSWQKLAVNKKLTAGSVFVSILISIFGTISIMARFAFANVVGVDTQNFNPTTSGLDFVTVQSSETLEPGILNFGVFLNYSINSLPNYQDQVTQSRMKSRDRLLSSDLNFGLGLSERWDMGMSIPAVLSQQVEEDVFKGVFNKTGMTDIRLNSKFRLMGKREGGVAFIGTIELPQVANNPFYGSSNKPTYNLELAADTTWNKMALAVNIGYRIRGIGDPIAGIPISPIGNMWIASLAASYLFTNFDTKLISEIYSSLPTSTTATQTDRELSSIEILLGAKHDLRTEVALHSGVATTLNHGTFSPDWRLYVGLNWAMGPLWGKKPVVEKSMALVPPVTTPIAGLKARGENDIVENGTPDPGLAVPGGSNVATPTGGIAEITTVNTTPENTDYMEGRSPDERELFVVRHINFKSGSARIPVDFKRYLEKLATYLNLKPPFKRLVITGHTDSVGSPSYNLKLSRARAHTVKLAMVQLFDLPEEKIQADGFGIERPVADNGNYQGRAQNRRVEFFIER